MFAVKVLCFSRSWRAYSQNLGGGCRDLEVSISRAMPVHADVLGRGKDSFKAPKD